jgi:Flp pilus assembly protein TadD
MRLGIARAFVIGFAGLWLAGCSTSGGFSNPFETKSPGADASPPVPAVADSEPTGSISPILNSPAMSAQALSAQASEEPDLPAGDAASDIIQGKTEYRANHFSRAEKYFRRAAEHNPHDEEAWLGLAAAYDRLQRFAQADQAYSRAIAIAGATAEILNNQGYSYMLRGDYKHAHEKLIAAQRKDPHNKFVQNNLHLLEESARRGMAID